MERDDDNENPGVELSTKENYQANTAPKEDTEAVRGNFFVNGYSDFMLQLLHRIIHFKFTKNVFCIADQLVTGSFRGNEGKQRSSSSAIELPSITAIVFIFFVI